MRAAVGASIAYFAVAFAAGVVLGTVREIVVAPRLGGLAAVALEVPIMLAISWVAAGAFIRRFAVPATIAARLTMGGLAFLFLQAAELALGSAFGTPPTTYVAALATAKGALGLSAQVGFALLPLALLRRD